MWPWKKLEQYEQLVALQGELISRLKQSHAMELKTAQERLCAEFAAERFEAAMNWRYLAYALQIERSLWSRIDGMPNLCNHMSDEEWLKSLHIQPSLEATNVH
jgi:hypothetical protein